MADETGHKATSDTELLVHVADIVSAYVRRNPVGASALPDLIRTVHQSLNVLNGEAAAPLREKHKPAVPVAKTVQQAATRALAWPSQRRPRQAPRRCHRDRRCSCRRRRAQPRRHEGAPAPLAAP